MNPSQYNGLGIPKGTLHRGSESTSHIHSVPSRAVAVAAAVASSASTPQLSGTFGGGGAPSEREESEIRGEDKRMNRQIHFSLPS